MKSFLIGLVASLALPTLGCAQYFVQGKVTNAQQQPLVGATVVVPRTTLGTATDARGNYQIKVEEVPAELQVSYVGYQSRTIPLAADSDTLVRDVVLREDISLEEVVIQAIRADEQAPVTQTTIDQQGIEAVYVGQDALFALEELTPAVLAYSESGTNISNYGQMRLRGIDQTRINITLDGVPLNDMIDQGVFFSNFTDFGNSIASVQVQRGVGTSTNGTASYAGSINFESVDLNDSVPSVEAQLMGGSFNTYRLSGEAKTGLLANKTAFYGRFTRTNSDGYRDHSSTNSYSFFFSGGYFGRKSLLKVTGFTGRSQNGLAYLPVALSDIQRRPRTNYVSENDIDEFGQSLILLQYTRFVGINTTWTSTLYYGAAGGDFPIGFSAPANTFSVSGSDTVFNTTDQFTQLNYPLLNDHYGLMSTVGHTFGDDRWELDGGVHAYTFRRENQEAVLPDDANPYYQDRSRKDEFSTFAKLSYSYRDWLLFADLQLRAVNLQLRADTALLEQPALIPDRQWLFLNPKVGVTYQLSRLANLYASYGRSGREPTRFDILGAAQINRFNLASVQDRDAVQAEYVNDFEVGVRVNATRFSGQANLFHMQFTNEIAPIGQAIPEGFIQLRKNIASSYRRGLEVTGEYRVFPALTFTGNLSYLQSNIATFAPEDSEQIYQDVEPIISPTWIANGSLAYQVDAFSVALSARYVSESFLEPTNQPELTLPAFFVLNARASVRFLKNQTLSIHLNNLLDEPYYTFGQPVQAGEATVPGYFVQAPFNAYVLLQLRF
ncbi:MAG: TonB-dependent receptor [Tunicatimonas sp.]